MNDTSADCKVWVASCGGSHLPNTAKAFEQRDALSAFWSPNKNSTAVHGERYTRCWPFHLLMKPFYHLASQIVGEKVFYAFQPAWQQWVRRTPAPEFNVVHSCAGFASELFDIADRTGALKVVDCANSHPTSYHGFWQRECDLWCPGEKIPIPRRFLARMNRDIQRADLILCPSTFVRDSMVYNGIPAERCFINPFGVDTSIFTPRIALPERPRFVAVGTICVRKGFQYLFRAFELVKKELPDAELVVVGDYKVDFEKERRRWEGTFTHYPHLNHEELGQLLRTCTAFVFPSTEEGFARVIPEAMGAGLPIVATHESGATTLVEDGVEGFIIRRREPQHIADLMIQVATDHDLNYRMGIASREKGGEKNTWLDYGDRLLAEYRRRLTMRP